MKADDLPKTSMLENNIMEATLGHYFHDALLTFSFSYGSRYQFGDVPLSVFWRWMGWTTLKKENPQSWDTIKIEQKPDAHPI